jgi:hypothetical protein
MAAIVGTRYGKFLQCEYCKGAGFIGNKKAGGERPCPNCNGRPLRPFNNSFFF